MERPAEVDHVRMRYQPFVERALAFEASDYMPTFTVFTLAGVIQQDEAIATKRWALLTKYLETSAEAQVPFGSWEKVAEALTKDERLALRERIGFPKKWLR